MTGQQQPQRQLLILVSVVAAASLAVGLLVADRSGSAPPRSTSPPSGHLIVLRGNGFGAADFGQPAPTAMAALQAALGAPKSSRPVDLKGNCTIDSAMEWPTMTAYFFHGAFVGYATGSLVGGPGINDIPHDVATAAGLRVGDRLTRAAQLYGGALRTSYAQGGSWIAATSTGRLAGYLTSELHSTNPAPRIADITAGSLGCPAASP